MVDEKIKPLTPEQLWYFGEPEQLAKYQVIEEAVKAAARKLKCNPDEIIDRIDKLFADIKQLEEQIIEVKATIKD